VKGRTIVFLELAVIACFLCVNFEIFWMVEIAVFGYVKSANFLGGYDRFGVFLKLTLILIL
jgi:hypothetical protein